MISAGDFKNGLTFEMDGQLMQVIEFQHVKPGKGAAFVRTKMRNIISGAVIETSFNPTAKFPRLSLKEEIWNTATPTAIFTTLWIPLPSIRSPSMQNSFPKASSLLRKA